MRAFKIYRYKKQDKDHAHSIGKFEFLGDSMGTVREYKEALESYLSVYPDALPREGKTGFYAVKEDTMSDNFYVYEVKRSPSFEIVKATDLPF